MLDPAKEGHTITFANGETATFCHEFFHQPFRIYRPVVNCSRYVNANQPARHELEKIAWTLNTDKSGQRIGFTPPAKKDD